jgi:hypothetical protein
MDPLELLRIAGREAGSQAFEQRVLSQLAALRTGLDQLAGYRGEVANGASWAAPMAAGRALRQPD